MIFRLGELFCEPGDLACGAKMAGSVMANGEEYAIQHAWATDYDPAACEEQRPNPSCISLLTMIIQFPTFSNEWNASQ